MLFISVHCNSSPVYTIILLFSCVTLYLFKLVLITALFSVTFAMLLLHCSDFKASYVFVKQLEFDNPYGPEEGAQPLPSSELN